MSDLSASSFDNGDIGTWRYIYTTDTSAISEAILANDSRILKLMLKKRKKKPLPLPADGFQGWTALHIAASRRKYIKCLEILLLYGDTVLVNVNAKTRQGRTALHIACANNCISAVRYLLKNGAKTDICDNYTRLALHYAVLNGRTEIFQLILQSTDVSRIEKYCSLMSKIELRENHIYWSLTCCAISSGNLECFSALMTSKLPQSILQSPTILVRSDVARVFSPLTFLLHSYNKNPKKLDSFLPLLLKYEVIMPDMFHSVLRMGMPIWPYNYSSTLVYANPFSAIFIDSLPLSKQQHYFNLLIANNVTPDYCLQCYGDTSKPYRPSYQGGEDSYLHYYRPVLDGIKKGKTNAVKLLISNSAILELDDLIVHFWFCLIFIDSIGFSESMYQYLISLKPLYYIPRCQWGSLNEEFATASLQQLCRTAIRQQLRGPTLEDNLRHFRRRILELPLPSMLKDYLLFKN